MVRGSLVDTSSRWGLLAPQNAEVTAVGDLLQGRLTAPPEQTGPRDTQSSTMHTEPRVVTDTYQTHPQVRGRSWRLINIVTAVLLPGRLTAQSKLSSEHLSSTTPTEPRNTVPDASCKTQLSQEGAPGASKNAQGGHCLMAKMPYVALYRTRHSNQKYLSKNDRQWQSVWVAFCVLGRPDRQRRRRVRFVQEVEA
jgi:hypothetical protein